MNNLYTTKQINLQPGEALRITAGRRTVYVHVNKRGLHLSRGGYLKRPRRRLDR